MRNHHTRRRKPRDPAPRAPGTDEATETRILEGRTTFYQNTCTGIDSWCNACGNYVPPGHTIFVPRPGSSASFLFCWICGVALLVATDQLDPDPDLWPPSLAALPGPVLSPFRP